MLQTSASFGRTAPGGDESVNLSEVISALTFALDLTENAVPGHSLRTCLLGMRLAEAAGLPSGELNDLYYALLLKDIGCADHVTRLTQIMAEDHAQPLQYDLAADLAGNPLLLEHVWREVLPGVPLPGQIGRLAGVEARRSDQSQPFLERSEGHRGAATMRHLNMSDAIVEAVASLNERWDGSGSPDGLKGDQIPRLARICAIAQTLDAFAMEHGSETAMRMLRARRGTWFDPELARVAQSLHTSGRLWQHCQPREVESTRKEVLRISPGVSSPLSSAHMDRICEAFGNVVDAKSPFTYHHSLGVTEVAVAIAEELGLADERVSLVRRAAFLHDIGKLAVPNHILDKRGRLDAREWAIVTRHPRISGEILQRVGAFGEMSSLAAEHHERLDGSGYPFGLTGDQISLESRVIAMADCYAAMAEDRPYRPGLDPQNILEEIGLDVPYKLDTTCFLALQCCVRRWRKSMPDPRERKEAATVAPIRSAPLSLAV